jgi:two-component system, NarL family, response regulator
MTAVGASPVGDDGAKIAVEGSMDRQRSVRVLVVDDHDLVREGIVAVVGQQADLHVVASAASGKDALALCERERPDVVLLDLRMPGMDGVETLAQIRARFPEIKTLMLSSHDGDEAIYRAMKAGAAGYVLKKQPSSELAEAIRGALTGNVRLAPEVSAQLSARLSQPTLTGREIEVLDRAARGDSNKAIAQVLGISPSTAKNHIDHILDKLGAADRTQAVTIALQRGILTLE